MGDRYLIIGGDGFLGRWIIELLLRRDEPNIFVFDLRSHFDDVKYFIGDLTKYEDINNAIKRGRISIVINTVSPLTGLGDDIYWKVNVDGTKNVIRACIENGVQKLIHTSSASVLFDGVSDLVNADETTPYPEKYADAYNETKAKAEALVLEANGKNNLLTCALRPSAIFGPKDRTLIPGIIAVVKRGQTKFQIGDNSNLFDYSYVENVAYAHILAADKMAPDNKIGGEAFLITNGAPVPFWDFLRFTWAQFKHYPPFVIKMPRSVGLTLASLAEWSSYLQGKEPGFTRFRVKFSCANRYFNITKAKTILGYEPIIGLEEGLRRSCQYFIEELNQGRLDFK
ncbi:9413_t:CDS:2 [Paraglomus brasilianum]|uniref:9413_t:CDS:1 n=1 Tax=Paraglomus brasilianum TaxID=144538 RepID=A0A9N8ZIW1_9GLOM|nr:9413_t:CDS:2 [Paraglomus brasilianum]